MNRRRFVAAARTMPLSLVRAQEPVVAPGRRLLAADYETGRIARIAADGRIEWEGKVGPIHDLHSLPGGNILYQSDFQHLVEVDPRAGRNVWEYDAGSRNGNAGRPVEVHAFQRLANGRTLIAESGPARIIEVDRRGDIQAEIRLRVENPHPHTDTRLARKLDNGHYLVCHERDGAVREYDAAGRVVWEYRVPLFGRAPAGGHGPEAFGNQCFAALRLRNGHTLVATGNGHAVLEVDPAGKIVWSVAQNDLPGITLAWVTTLQVLKNGNVVLGNCHAGPGNPQIVEITREKKVVWTYKDFVRFGNALANSQMVDAKGSLR